MPSQDERIAELEDQVNHLQTDIIAIQTDVIALFERLDAMPGEIRAAAVAAGNVAVKTAVGLGCRTTQVRKLR